MDGKNKLKLMKNLLWAGLGLCIGMLAACGEKRNQNTSQIPVDDTVQSRGELVNLPAPSESNKNYCKVIGWPAGKTPIPPAGFEVTQFASGIKSPRWIYVARNGDVFVALANTESKGVKKVVEAIEGKAKSQNTGKSPNQIILFKNGKPENPVTFLSGLNQPLGMLILNNYFYVANTDGLLRYPYKEGQTNLAAKGEKILDLPAGMYNNHWTRNIIANEDGSKIYVTVGSGSNVAEHGMENEARRANILEINPDGSGERVYASGLRNPVGMDWAPGSGMLWTAVNERDELGDSLVPDYITGVKEGGFYGWPYSYFGQHIDSRIKKEEQRPELVNRAIMPDVPLGSHTASLGLVFYDQNKFPERYRNGAFIGQHGSWNHSQLVGYKVVFVPFKNGKPSGPPEDFLIGFIADEDKSEVYGRPVGVAVTMDGALLVADDASDTIWKVNTSG
jgi:glucose/arabinose dehydrogenase